MEVLLKRLMKPSKILDANLPDSSPEKATTLTVNITSTSEFHSGYVFHRKSSLCNFLKIYFDFAYYSLISPFHFEVDHSHGWLLIKSWKPQQLLCGLLHFLGIFRLLVELRISFPNVLSQNPLQYFEILGNGFKLMFKTATIKRLWWNQTDFQDMMNFIRAEKNLPDPTLRIQNRYIVSLICGLYSITCFSITFGGYIIAPSSTWEKSWWNRSLVNDGRYAAFLINRTELNVVPEPNDISTLDYVLALLLGIGLIERFIMGFYFDLCLLFAVLTLWSTSYSFSRSLHVSMKDQVWTELNSGSGRSAMSVLEKPSEKWMGLYQSYKGIRTLSQLINNAYGSMTTTFIAESILYHSMSMDAILLTKDIYTQVRLLFFIISSAVIFIFSADICCQMDTLKVWLSKDENRRYVPLDELNIVLHELHTSVIGIRGSNIFTITYSLVWNILTTVVTYFIICVQSRKSGGH